MGAVMETMKIRLKVGVHEFEAEGPPEEVKAQLAVWQELVVGARPVAGSGSSGSSAGVPAETEAGVPEGLGNGGGRRLFVLDDRKELVTLRAHPTGETRDADAVLLIVYGYRLLRDQDEVLVTKLLESLRVSGMNVDRIDRAVGPHLIAGYLLKTGRAKGGKYRLTNTGREHARRIAERLVDSKA
jgi:hypothetical protein